MIRETRRYECNEFIHIYLRECKCESFEVQLTRFNFMWVCVWVSISYNFIEQFWHHVRHRFKKKGVGTCMCVIISARCQRMLYFFCTAGATVKFMVWTRFWPYLLYQNLIWFKINLATFGIQTTFRFSSLYFMCHTQTNKQTRRQIEAEETFIHRFYCWSFLVS